MSFNGVILIFMLETTLQYNDYGGIKSFYSMVVRAGKN